jgi:hypothetical protein
VKPDDTDKAIEYTIETIKGTRNSHSIRFVGAMDVNKLMKKGLSYLCCFYVDGNFLLVKMYCGWRNGKLK